MQLRESTARPTPSPAAAGSRARALGIVSGSRLVACVAAAASALLIGAWDVRSEATLPDIVCRVHRTSAIRVRVAHRPGAPRASRGPGTERGAREHAQRRAVPRFEVTNATSAGFAFLDRKRGDWPERVDDVLARRTTSRRLPWSSRSTVDRLQRSAGRQNTSNTPARFASRPKKSRLWDDVARRNPRRFLRTQTFQVSFRRQLAIARDGASGLGDLQPVGFLCPPLSSRIQY